MQTIADLQFLDFELEGLTSSHKIIPSKYEVEFIGNEDFVRQRVAHLEFVNEKQTLYTIFTDTFKDTNAYAFHNLYPYKGKFYPRIPRCLINGFGLTEKSIILDPYNGCGTTTLESSLIGIKSIGIDINPIGCAISRVKNGLLFIDSKELDFDINQITEIFKNFDTLV